MVVECEGFKECKRTVPARNVHANPIEGMKPAEASGKPGELSRQILCRGLTCGPNLCRQLLGRGTLHRHSARATRCRAESPGPSRHWHLWCNWRTARCLPATRC